MTTKILLIDDSADFQRTLAGVLTDAGYILRLAFNEAGAFAAITQESFDFALIDVRLHGDSEDDESGLSLAMALRGLDPQIHVILLTRYIRTKQIVTAIRYHGVLDFVEKTPDICEQLLKIIANPRQERERPRFQETGGATHLSFTLGVGRPLLVRAQGRYTCSIYSSATLLVDVERYARRIDLAKGDLTNLLFYAKEIGGNLWSEVFETQPEIARTYWEAIGRSRSLSLRFETSRDLLRLPLELMRATGQTDYLVLQHPLTRFVLDTAARREVLSPLVMALTRKLRVLIIASNTEPPIDGVDDEAQRLSDYLEHQGFIPVDVTLIRTRRATYERVRGELGSKSYDIVHYAGHGSFDQSSPEESSLYFWADEDQGAITPMKASELNMLLQSSEVRLIYLSCCRAATSSKAYLCDDDFIGVAEAAAQAGVPSVLSLRWPVSSDEAPKMALAFYRSLLEQGNPEIALWNARRELAAVNRDDPTWLAPVLIHQE